jgi:Holliday junction resolvase
MGKSQRVKGAAGEREAAKILSEELNIPVKRVLDQTREGGCDLVIKCEHITFKIEVKRQEKTSVYKWFEQVEASCTGHRDVPIVMFRTSRKQWLFLGNLQLLIRTLREENPVSDRLVVEQTPDDSGKVWVQ